MKKISIDGPLMLHECGPGDSWKSGVAAARGLPWFMIERVSHRRGRDFTPWLDRCVSDVEIEGSSADMLGLARAIERREDYRAEHVATRWRGGPEDDDEVYLWCPHRSTVQASVPRAVADALAAQIRERLGVKS